jgi:hypothetical protein
MTGTDHSFDHRPDPELGAALRQALEPGDEAAFVAGVVARFDAMRASEPMWDVLAAWARHGIAAALLVAALAGLAVRSRTEPVALLDAALAGSESGITTALLTGQSPPDETVLFGDAVEPW